MTSMTSQETLITMETHCQILSKYRFPVTNEKDTQAAMFQVLGKFCYEREVYLDRRSIVDFYHKVTQIGIEVKIKGNAMAIYKQIERYCKFDSVSGLILVTNKSMGCPKEINGKPIIVFPLGQAWL